LARLNPPPTRRIPVLIGGGGERKTLRMVARHADAWHAFGNVDTLAHKSRVLDDWCAEVGRDPSEIERSTGVRPGFDAERAEALYDLGIRQFTIGLGGPRYDLSTVPDWIAWRDAKNS
jgi:alkanesulfonate monooxygenase SsuD/methylene tetrahydromethanopterin reductase-like flavin-dependent oxidoreductase (luciferase family)